MVRLKPLVNISEKVASYVKFAGRDSLIQAMPVKSIFKELKLALLQKDTLALSTVPKRYASQGERLKDFYNSKGIPYLLPNEEWSDKKIFDTINLLGKDLDKLIESKTLNKQTLQENIKKLIPEAEGKIIIKDFDDLEKLLASKGYSEDEIRNYRTNVGASTVNGRSDTTIYLKFEKLNGDKDKKIDFKGCVGHEMEHVLSLRYQNKAVINDYKSDSFRCLDHSAVFSNIFCPFENHYDSVDTWGKIEISSKGLLNAYGFDSKESLYEDFDRKLNNLIKQSKAYGSMNFGSDKKSWKHFFDCMKFRAEQEKKAYQIEIDFKKEDTASKSPKKQDLFPLLYGEMENFFAQKRIQVNK